MLLVNNSKMQNAIDVYDHIIFLRKYVSTIETLQMCINDLRTITDWSADVHRLRMSWTSQLEATRASCAEEVEWSQALFGSFYGHRVGLPAQHYYREPYPLEAYYYHPLSFSRRAP